MRVVAVGPGGEFIPEVDERPHRQKLPHRFLDSAQPCGGELVGALLRRSPRALDRNLRQPLQIRRPCGVFQFPQACGTRRGGVTDTRWLCGVFGEDVEFGEGLGGADAMLRPGDRLARINPLKLTRCPFSDFIGLGEVGGDLLQLVDAFQRGVELRPVTMSAACWRVSPFCGAATVAAPYDLGFSCFEVNRDAS